MIGGMSERAPSPPRLVQAAFYTLGPLMSHTVDPDTKARSLHAHICLVFSHPHLASSFDGNAFEPYLSKATRYIKNHYQEREDHDAALAAKIGEGFWELLAAYLLAVMDLATTALATEARPTNCTCDSGLIQRFWIDPAVLD